MTENRKAPKLRFKGFTDAWEQRKLGDVGTTYTGLSGKAKEDFGHGNGKFITYMNVFSNSVASSEMTEPVEIDDRQNKVISGDVLFTTSSETPEEVGMSSVWLEKSENTYLNSFCFGYRPSIVFEPYYLAYMFRSSSVRKKITFLAQGISRYNISKNKMMNIEIFVPTMSEQQQVGEYLRKLDHLITLHQRKLDRLKNIKKSMLDKMFPKDGEVVPEIRFKGFTDAWEQRKFSDVVEIGSGMDYKHLGIGDIPVYGTGGYMLSVDVALSENNDAIGIGRKGTIDKPYILRAPFWTVDTLFYCIPKYNHNLDFTNCLFQNVDWKNKDESTGVPSLSKVIINNIETSIPSYEEQKKIGEYFKSFDNLITLHQRKSQYYIRRIRKECLMI